MLQIGSNSVCRPDPLVSTIDGLMHIGDEAPRTRGAFRSRRAAAVVASCLVGAVSSTALRWRARRNADSSNEHQEAP